MGDDGAEEGVGDDDVDGCHLSVYCMPDVLLDAYMHQTVEQNSRRHRCQSRGPGARHWRRHSPAVFLGPVTRPLCALASSSVQGATDEAGIECLRGLP